MGTKIWLELLLTDFFSVRISSSKYKLTWVEVAKKYCYSQVQILKSLKCRARGASFWNVGSTSDEHAAG